MNRLRIKICGLTIASQVQVISQMGADAVGFVLYPKSPRYVASEKLSELLNHVSPLTTSVAVVVNEEISFLRQLYKKTKISLFQLHGEESPKYCEELTKNGISWIKAIRVRTKEDIQKIAIYPEGTFLLDTWTKGQYGGTGQEIPETWLTEIPKKYPIILAGGISAENVEQKLDIVAPYGIDVSSSVEMSPGIKDIEQVQCIFSKVALWQCNRIR